MKTTREMIDVMEAADRGAVIQIRARNDSKWFTQNGPIFPSWNWTNYDYRVEPKPLECWAFFRGRDVIYCVNNNAPLFRPIKEGERFVKMSEVIE